MLLQITLTVNIIALAAPLWLGPFLVPRGPRSPFAWLTGLTLWSAAGLFMNVLLALNPPPEPADLPAWVGFLAPFWTSTPLRGGRWVQGRVGGPGGGGGGRGG